MSHTSRLTRFQEPLSALCEEYGVRELSAFGSVLRDDFDETSDIDLLVEFLPERTVGLFHLIRFQRGLEELFERSVDLVPKDGLKPMIRDVVLGSSERIYAA